MKHIRFSFLGGSKSGILFTFNDAAVCAEIFMRFYFVSSALLSLIAPHTRVQQPHTLELYQFQSLYLSSSSRCLTIIIPYNIQSAADCRK